MTDGDGDAGDRESAVDSDGSGGDRDETTAETYAEPEEFDPRDRFGDPETEMVSVPEVDVPEVENPADRLPDPSEVDKEVRDAFWAAVLWMDVALACLVLGPLYAVLEGGVRLGGAVTVVGLLAAFRLYQTIRAFRQD
ncbi:MAG: hypothetical protein ABEI99_04810 [Halobaculum sp.]